MTEKNKRILIEDLKKCNFPQFFSKRIDFRDRTITTFLIHRLNRFSSTTLKDIKRKKAKNMNN